MDGRRFDRWTRSLIAIGTRRSVTRTLLAGTLGVLLLHVGRNQADAKCVALGKKCDKKNTKKDRCCEGRCKGKKCRCRRGREACGTRCCAQGEICAGGLCVPPGQDNVPPGQGDCPDGADTCNGLAVCNGNCNCVQRFGGGTRCVGGISGFCGACLSDGDCADLGPGAVCMVSHEPGCTQCNPGLGRCAAPCAT